MKRRLGIVVSIGALAMSAGCGGHAKEGDPCESEIPQCPDQHTLLECANSGLYRAIPCPGLGGCTTTSDNDQTLVTCDLSNSQPGTECPENFPGFVICEPGTSALVCDTVHWNTQNCPTHCRDGIGGIGAEQDPGECD